MSFHSIPFLARATLPAGGGGNSYLSDTYTAGADTIVITRPAGAGASQYLTAIAFTTLGGQSINTMSAPTDWTASTGVINAAEGRTARAFTAIGNAANLTFSATGLRGVLCIATTAPLRNIAFEAVDYSGPSNSSNRATPPVTAVANDLGVSIYIQVDDGASGPLVTPGTVSPWTRRYFKNDTVPYISVLSRDALTAGSTGSVAHDANGNFSSRFLFTGVYGT